MQMYGASGIPYRQVVLIYWMDFQWVIRMEKRTASDDVVPLCGIVGDYRTFIEDFKRELEFVEWLEGRVLMKNVYDIT